MTDANEPEAGSRPLALAATHATDPDRLALAVTHGSHGASQDVAVREDRSEPGFALSDTHVPGSEHDQPPALQLATARTMDVGAQDTVDSGQRMARPEFADPEERRRRQALKARLFGEAEDAVKIGRFQVLGRLGAGGMGVVYAAYDERLDRKIAVKVLRQDGGSLGKQRLLREAQAMARLSHPNIVGVHEVGEDGDSVYVAMEFVRGKSLDRWLEEPRPWREVLAVFVAAGRGLQAAHEAGLIHRDFKPANAILGDDGRVKVLDFGLARAGAAEELEEAKTSLMAIRLTRTGAMMGTPAYMSPEQFAAEELTAASDQFSFFVALYEALYRGLPFTGDSVGALAVSVTQGRPAEPPGGSEVPAWVRSVVMRGLGRVPASRFPDMTTALAALERDPAKRRRRLAAVLGLVVASGGASAGAMSLAGADGGRCEGVAAAVTSVWNEERSAAAGAAFGRSGGLGAETWSLIQPRIGGWVDEWVRLRGERCAAYAAGELSDTLHDRSVACLERQLARVDAVVEAFVVADMATVQQAPTAVAALPSLTLCEDREFLLAEVPPPEDPAARVQVERGREGLERARAAIDLGDYAGALQRATDIADDARALDHSPLLALAEVVRGDALQWTGRVAEAVTALGAGLELGLASGDDRVAVEALARRIYVRTEFAGEATQALADAVIDRALLRRVPGDARLAWLVENNVAVAAERAGHLDEAAAGYAAALQRAAELGEGGAFETMVAQFNLGLLDAQRGQTARASAEIAAAVTTAERLYGPNHPALMALLEGQASTAFELGRQAEASAICRRARELAAKLPGMSPQLPTILALMAEIANERREPAEALATEAVKAAKEVHGADSPAATFTAMRVWPYSEAREAALSATRTTLKTTAPPLWADATVLRVRARVLAGAPAVALIDEIQADPAWANVAPRHRVTMGLRAAEAAIAEGQPAKAKAALDEVEALGREVAPFGLQMRVDYLRGVLAEVDDPQLAVTLLRRSAEGYAATFDADHPTYLAVRAALARALRASGAGAEAGEIGRDVVRKYRSLGAGFEREAAALEKLFKTDTNR